ncbi:hypothetical protein ES705_43819 [subsurface metagenome]
MEAWINCFGKSLYCVIQDKYGSKIAYLVTGLHPVPRDLRWKYVWKREPSVYKIHRRFGIFT